MDFCKWKKLGKKVKNEKMENSHILAIFTQK